jgi:squalene cyclase
MWFAGGVLAACGRKYKNSLALRKACEFLLSKQLPNGGWGESYLSSQNKVWSNLFKFEFGLGSPEICF